MAVQEQAHDEMRSVRRGVAAPGLQRRVVSLAAPVIGENLLQTLLGVVDTILVAGLGAVALAGVGTALQTVFVLLGGLSAFAVGGAVLVAQAIGAEDREQASRIAQQAIVWSIIASLPLSVVGVVLAEPLMRAFGLAPDVTAVAVEYLHVTMATVATILVMFVGGGILRGVGDSRTPMLVTAASNIVNIGISYALIYGAFGLPALGAVGSAWGTFLSRLLGSLLIVAVLFKGRSGVRIGGGSWRPDFSVARRILHIGAPAALEEVLIIGAIMTLTPIVAMLGTTTLAAHRVVINVLMLSFLPGIGFGLAATSLVGQSTGARNLAEARSIANIAFFWALAWMGGLGAIFLVFSEQLVHLFSNDPALVLAGGLAIRAVAITQPFWAATFVFSGALRGTGNTVEPLLISSVAVWLTVAIAALVVSIWPQLWAVWFAFVLSSPIEAFVMWRRWRRQVVVR